MGLNVRSKIGIYLMAAIIFFRGLRPSKAQSRGSVKCVDQRKFIRE
jgi:hypothetical protein